MQELGPHELAQLRSTTARMVAERRAELAALTQSELSAYIAHEARARLDSGMYQTQSFQYYKVSSTPSGTAQAYHTQHGVVPRYQIQTVLSDRETWHKILVSTYRDLPDYRVLLTWERWCECQALDGDVEAALFALRSCTNSEYQLVRKDSEAQMLGCHLGQHAIMSSSREVARRLGDAFTLLVKGLYLE